jgi:3-deoxy-D-manno-octulosonic-acid transferase
MNFAYSAYRLLTSGLFLTAYAPVRLYSRLAGGREAELHQRLGRYDAGGLTLDSGGPRIWLHAVSVGEVRAASAIVRGLMQIRPGLSLVVSSTTEAGRAQARKLFGPPVACIFAPFDFPGAVSNALKTIRPDLLALCETELWPNWIDTARRLGIRTALVNGRISERSFDRYLRIRPLIGPVLDRLQVFSMISRTDARRIRKMGAAAHRLRVNGNAKYDGLTDQVSDSARSDAHRLLDIGPGDPVLVAGSIRGDEMRIVIEAFSRIRSELPEVLLVAAPRHLSNVPVLEDFARKAGFTVDRKSRLERNGASRTAPVLVLDTIGELMGLYAAASVVFCGGSLVPLGGQNILEPAAWGKPVLYGPSTGDFADARQIIERFGGGQEVADGPSLADRALFFLTHRDEVERVGKRARAAAETQAGAGRRHAEEIVRLLEA